MNNVVSQPERTPTNHREAMVMMAVSIIISLGGLLFCADWLQRDAAQTPTSSAAICHVGQSNAATCSMMHRTGSLDARLPGWNQPFSASLYGKCCGCFPAPAASAAFATRLDILSSGWTLAPPNEASELRSQTQARLRFLRFASATPRAPPISL